jgi:hypothetical protein
MDVFYHVDFLQRRKKCKIKFSYTRDPMRYITGDILIYCRNDELKISFENYKYTINEDEKQFILNRVLKNLNING